MDQVNSFEKKYVIGNKTYIVYVHEDVKYIKPEKGEEVVKYDDFIKTEWRTWINEKGGTSTDVPKSTFFIPLKLTKVIGPANLISIAEKGFIATKENVALMGFSKGTVYATRDMHILGVWLGRTSEVGEQFLEEDEGSVILFVEVSELFRDMFMRDSHAVLYGDNDKSGSTVVCFAPIPPECLYIELPENVVNPIKEKFGSAKNLTSGYQQLNKLGKNLKLVSDALISKAKTTKKEDDD